MDMSQHPAAATAATAPAPADGPHARIVAALHRRAGSASPDAADAPPAPSDTLAGALADDATRAPQTEFVRARQVQFLENLSITGSVRSAAAAGGVSHQTAYRARRSQQVFRLAWDAALLAARAHAETVLACRAIDGVEEKVFYHGEAVATRTRYSDRLLLAHLARLDRHAADARIAAVAEDYDGALARFEAGEDMLVAPAEPAPAPASAPAAAPPENFSPGPCNTRSMSRPDAPRTEVVIADGEGEPGEDPPFGEDDDYDGGGCGSADDYADLFAGESGREARLPLVSRLLAAMERRRPADAPAIVDRWGGGNLEAEQIDAFTARLSDWWAVIPPPADHPADEWCYHPDHVPLSPADDEDQAAEAEGEGAPVSPG